MEHSSSREELPSAHLRLRKWLTSHQGAITQPVLLLADHGIADSEHSHKHKTYTFAQTIAASEGALPCFGGHRTPWVYDVAVDRYWPSLDKVENRKIARGTKDFLKASALEPQRLMQAIAFGGEISDQHGSGTLLYISDIGAGNDIASEALIRTMLGFSDEFASVNTASYISFKNQLAGVHPNTGHPFNFLERFGGYETAVITGMISKALVNDQMILLEGWSGMAALALADQLHPEPELPVIPVSIPPSFIIDHFLISTNRHPLFMEKITQEGGEFFGRTTELIAGLNP